MYKFLNTDKTTSKLALAMLLSVFLNLTGCGYNTLQEQDEAVSANWSEVLNQYKRRSALIPNIVAVTKKYASHEQEVLNQITQARASANSIQVTKEVLNDPNALKKFQAAQAQMGSALSRLMAVSENYPELKADQVFKDLTAQLEGTENRIAVARRRYIESIKKYNGTVRKFPTNITAKAFGMDKKENFTVDDQKQISQAPKVKFD